MTFDLGDWWRLLVLGLCLGAGFALGAAVANTIVEWLRR